MGAQVVSFLNWSPRPAPQPVADWSQQELAEFYRVEGALIRAGLRIETDRGVSDEGDPWFVFLRAEDGEVVVHFARIEGEYLIAGPAYEQVARGYDFNALVRAMIARHPLVQPQPREGNVLLHPAAILVAIVGTAFFKTGEAKAMESDRGPADRKAAVATTSPKALQTAAPAPAVEHVYLDANQALTIMAGAMFAMEPRFNHRDQAVSRAAMLQAEGVQARADLQAIDMSRAETLNFDGLAAETPHGPALARAAAEAPAILALTAMLDQVSANDWQDSTPISTHEVAAPVLSGSTSADVIAPVYLDVQLRAGALPSVESVVLLQQIMGGAGFEKIAVVAVDKIPEAIREIISHGADFTSANVADVPHIIAPSPVPVVVAPPTADDLPAENDNPAPDAPIVDYAPTPEPVVTAPLTPTPPSAAAPTPAAPVVDGYKVLAQKLIDYFVAHVPHTEVMTAGKEIIFYDSRVLEHPDQLRHIDSVTFHFNDGSSVSLVGEHSSLYPNLS